MKRIHLLLCLLISVQLLAQEQKTFKADSAQLAGKLKALGSVHPRLLLLKGEEAGILSQVKKQPEWNAVHNAILAECDGMMDLEPVDRIQTGRRLLGKSRECLRRVFQLSYAYRTTKNEKYLKRAEKELLAVSAFSDWNPSHFLDVAEMTMAVAIGYDWLYESLSEGSRKTIREAIITKGLEQSMDKKYNGFLTAEHNWNQVCNAGMTFGALAIAEDSPALAEKIIRRAVETIPKSMYASFQPDGAYPEGYGYWDYGTSFNVLFLNAIEKALGTDYGLSTIPGFLKTAGFLENMIGPTSLVDNWGDSGLKANLSPAAFWFASRLKEPSLLWKEKEFLQGKNTQENVKNRLLPTLLIWGANTEIKNIKPPKNRIWVGQGNNPVALMRTSWTDPNAIFVGFKAGSASVNHAHMDIGSFVLDAMGERWAMDFGPQEYNSLETKGVQLFGRSQDAERWQIFRYNNLVHNTLTIDGQNQQVKGYAKIDAWSGTAANTAAVSDLTGVYLGQMAAVKRGISIVDEKYVVVRDEVKSPDKPITLRWTLLTAAQVKVIDDRKVELSQNGKKMYLIFETKAKIAIKTWSTVPTHDYDAPNPNTQLVGFEVVMPANSEASFNAYFSATGEVKPVRALSEWPVGMN